MEIKIIKKDDGEIVFIYEDTENKFEYNSFDKLIEKVYDNDIQIDYVCDEELKEYEELIKGIIEGARTTDYREAIKKAKEAKQNMESEEKE